MNHLTTPSECAILIPCSAGVTPLNSSLPVRAVPMARLLNTRLLFGAGGQFNLRSSQVVTKKCLRCNQEKSLDMFYKNCQKKDGLSIYCKQCARIFTQNWWERNPEAKKRNIRSTRLWRKTCPEKLKAYNILYRTLHPERKVAHNLISRAIEAGKIQRQPCEVCGIIETEAHHFDYSKPYEVVWLCKKHHKLLHLERELEGK